MFKKVWVLYFFSSAFALNAFAGPIADVVDGARSFFRLVHPDAANEAHDARRDFVKRFPKLPDGERIDKNLRFGFESEYALSECAVLLQHYRLDKYTQEEWNKLSDAERLKLVQDQIGSANVDRGDIGLVRGEEKEELSFMPEQLVLDSTGNLEIVLPPADSFEELETRVALINSTFGVGSMQGTAGIDFKVFYQDGAGQPSASKYEENLGFLNFIHLDDTLEKLSAGAGRYAKDPTKPTAQSFQHPFLGPITRDKQKLMKTYLALNRKGERLDPDAVMAVRNLDNSFKYIGGTAFRPDLAPGKAVVFEVRDAHKNTEILLERVARAAIFLEEGRNTLKGAFSWKAFDSGKLFDELPAETQAFLKEIFPSKAKPGVEYNESELKALEVARNFTFPLQDWSQVTTFFGTPELNAGIEQAQAAYRATIEQTRASYLAGEITVQQASAKLQGALCVFAKESGLAKAFSTFRNSVIESLAKQRAA